MKEILKRRCAQDPVVSLGPLNSKGRQHLRASHCWIFGTLGAVISPRPFPWTALATLVPTSVLCVPLWQLGLGLVLWTFLSGQIKCQLCYQIIWSMVTVCNFGVQYLSWWEISVTLGLTWSADKRGLHRINPHLLPAKSKHYGSTDTE